jgi:hypothetical protein
VTVFVEGHAASEQGMLSNVVVVFAAPALQFGVDLHTASFGQWSVHVSMRALIPSGMAIELADLQTPVKGTSAVYV